MGNNEERTNIGLNEVSVENEVRAHELRQSFELALFD
jgi:hypothetical protein